MEEDEEEYIDSLLKDNKYLSEKIDILKNEIEEIKNYINPFVGVNSINTLSGEYFITTTSEPLQGDVSTSLEEILKRIEHLENKTESWASKTKKFFKKYFYKL